MLQSKKVKLTPDGLAEIDMRQEMDFFAESRGRGNALKQTEFANGANLTVQLAAMRSGLSEKAIDKMRKRGVLYALSKDEGVSEFRYPDWQFEALQIRLAPILAELWKVGIGSWGVHFFMVTESDDLAHYSPREWIMDPERPLQTVAMLIQRRFADDQGAQ